MGDSARRERERERKRAAAGGKSRDLVISYRSRFVIDQ